MGEAVLEAIRKARTRARRPSPASGSARRASWIFPPEYSSQPVNLQGWDDFPLRDRVGAHAACRSPLPTTPTPPPTASSGSAPAAICTAWCCLPWARASAAASSSATWRSTARTATGPSAATSSSTYADDARMCGCGQRGHLEAYASATAVRQTHARGLGRGAAQLARQRLSQCHDLTPKLLAHEAEAGDALRWKSSPRRPAISPSASST